MPGYKYAPYSYSRVSLFEQCPAAWKFRYIDKLPEIKSPNMVVGSMIHQIVEQYLKKLKEKKEHTNLTLLELLFEKAQQALPDFAEELEAYRSGVANITLPVFDKVGIEVRVALDMDFEPVRYDDVKAFLRGRIDRIYQMEDKVVITDWKTDRYLPPGKEVVEKDRQTKLYALFASAFVDEVEEFIIELYFLRYGVSRKTSITRDEIDEIREWVLETIAKIEAEREWKPTPGKYCEWCSYLNYCPAAKEAVELAESPVLPERITPNQAVKYAQLYKMLGIVKNRLGEMLKQYVTENGRIEIAGEALDIWESETVRWITPEQKTALARVLAEAGVRREDIWELFSTSKSTVTSCLRKLKRRDLLDKALATGTVEKTSRFEFKKVA